ncbi:MAG: hypothetical protein DRO00_08325 [Thermoproteota archaeon]|nr:MAG: hypothetical protein DRO00_08325 [Candidatus Korarchaeota archaeon]
MSGDVKIKEVPPEVISKIVSLASSIQKEEVKVSLVKNTGKWILFRIEKGEKALAPIQRWMIRELKFALKERGIRSFTILNDKRLRIWRGIGILAKDLEKLMKLEV